MQLLLSLILCCAHVVDDRQTSGFVSVKEVIGVCDEETGDCVVGAVTSSGTATRIIWGGEYYWITAAHVCASEPVKGAVSLAKAVTVTEGGTGNEERIQSATTREDVDLCLMQANPGPARKVAKRDPPLGSAVHVLAYPGGIFVKDALPMYDGRFGGYIPGGCMTTIPVAGGSSGSGVINRQGELVGVVSSVMRNFNHFTISACLEQVREFLGPAAQQSRIAGESGGQKQQEAATGSE